MGRLHFSLFSVILFGVVGSAAGRVSWQTGGEYRLLSYQTEGFHLDPNASISEQAWGRHRLRLKPNMEVGILSVHLELDVLTGQVFGTTHSVGNGVLERRHIDRSDGYDGWTTLEPRVAWFEVKGPSLSLRLGQMQTRWGLGVQSDAMVWKRPSFVAEMSERWNGDLVDQIEIELRPLATLRTDGLSRFSLGLSVGSVYQDEYAALLDEGSATLLTASARLPLDDLELGVRVERRLVTKRNDEVVDYTSYNFFTRWAEPLLGLNSVLVLEGEGVYQTTSVRENSDPETPPSDRFYGAGIVVAAEYFSICPQLGLRLEGGLSTGDGGVSGDSVYHFDPDFKPSVFALPVVERWLSAHYAKKQSVINDLSEGARTMLPSDGALRSMAFAALKTSWRYSRLMVTASAIPLWRMGALRSVDGQSETLSIGSPGFVGTELATLTTFDLGDLMAPGWRLGLRWAFFAPQSITYIEKPIQQSSIRVAASW